MGQSMERQLQHGELGCWYPVAGVDRLCRRDTAGTSTGLCPAHQRQVLHLRWPAALSS
jgi:hypothetical protein